MKFQPVWVMLFTASFGWTVSAWAGQDEEAVLHTITQAVAGTATFSESRDKQAVLMLYADDYTGTQDGQPETKEAIDRWLTDYESELKQGNRLRFIGAVSNLKTGLEGATAWAIYDYMFQAVRDGEIEGQDAGTCTSLLRKERSVWRIFHDHCSKSKAAKP
ncbi:MAG: Nuclear transport factor 2 family protein [Nitrospira sp.]|jgi:ketosteroid isomerase-like protein|nr:MAG: Nuclear transport factor 2 family protein [Nitrospira sp.]